MLVVVSMYFFGLFVHLFLLVRGAWDTLSSRATVLNSLDSPWLGLSQLCCDGSSSVAIR